MRGASGVWFKPHSGRAAVAALNSGWGRAGSVQPAIAGEAPARVRPRAGEGRGCMVTPSHTTGALSPTCSGPKRGLPGTTTPATHGQQPTTEWPLAWLGAGQVGTRPLSPPAWLAAGWLCGGGWVTAGTGAAGAAVVRSIPGGAAGVW